LVSREGGAEGGGVGGIPPRPSVPPERSGGGQFRSKWVRAKFRIEENAKHFPSPLLTYCSFTNTKMKAGSGVG